jgi:hypothetical protein
MVFAVGSWNWNSSSVSTALIFSSWTRRTLSRVGPLVRELCLPPDRPPRSGTRHSDPCPQGHRSLCCASLGSAAPGSHLVLATRSVKLVAAYLLPTRLLIESDLTECLSGGFPVLMAGDLNAKHTDWNSRLITARVSLLRYYANRNSCLIYGPDSPTTAPYTHSATPTSLIKWLLRTLSYRCISVLHSARITCLSWSTPHADHAFETYWTATTSREWTGVLASKTDSREIPW